MRIDQLPKSDRIEDRRGGLSGIPGGRGGIGIGTVVILGLIGWALGIDPRILIEGAETISGNDRAQQQSDAGSTTSTGAPSDEATEEGTEPSGEATEESTEEGTESHSE